MTVVLPSASRRSRFLFELDAAACLAAPDQSLNAKTGHVATYSRASVKTAVDANLAPRTVPHSLPAFQWSLDPVSGLMVPALLLEDTRTNLMLWSQDLSNAAWTKSGSTITTNAAIGPDGYQTCDILYETATNAEHLVNQLTVGGAIADNTVCTMSASVRVGRTTVYVSMVKKDAVTVFGAYFNLITGVVTSSDAGITARIVPQANGFYRCSVTGSVGAGATQPQGRVQPQVGSLVYLGDITTGLYVTDLQFEVGATPSSRIINAGTALARSADQLTYAFNDLPRALTVYVRGINMGTAQINNGNNPYYALIGAAPSFFVLYETTGAKPIAQLTASAFSTAATSAGTNPSVSDSVEVMGTLTSAGVVDFAQSLNGATATGSTGAGAAHALPGTWGAGTLYLNAADTGAGFFAYQSVRIAAGVQTMAFMRTG